MMNESYCWREHDNLILKQPPEKSIRDSENESSKIVILVTFVLLNIFHQVLFSVTSYNMIFFFYFIF